MKSSVYFVYDTEACVDTFIGCIIDDPVESALQYITNTFDINCDFICVFEYSMNYSLIDNVKVN